MNWANTGGSGAMPPQTLRGMPTAFGGQQQPQPSGRGVSNRLPNGKLGMLVRFGRCRYCWINLDADILLW